MRTPLQVASNRPLPCQPQKPVAHPRRHLAEQAKERSGRIEDGGIRGVCPSEEAATRAAQDFIEENECDTECTGWVISVVDLKTRVVTVLLNND